jgi:hypothetical protein
VAPATDVNDAWFPQSSEVDPDVLEKLRAGATVVSIVDGATRTVSLVTRNE